MKRMYKHDEEGDLMMDTDGAAVLDYIKILHAGPEQRFSEGLVGGAILEGWIALKGEKITLLTKPRVVYLIKRKPGYYCCHCGDPIDGAANEARSHLFDEHKGKKSPDASNPSGYERIHYYDCVKVEKKSKGG